MHHDSSANEEPWNPSDEQGQVIERARPLVLELVHEVDPAVQVTLHPYRWHGDVVLDIGLALGGHAHHLQVTAARMEILMRDPHMLEHDIEGAVADLRRETAHGGGAGEPHSAGAAARVEHETQGAAPATPPAEQRAAEHAPAAPAPLYEPPSHVEEYGLQESHGSHGSHGVAPATPSLPPTPEERAVLDQTRTLAQQIVHHLDEHAETAFSEYRWHGDLVLDIGVSLHGHTHQLQVTVARAEIILRDPSMLEHDLEHVVHALHDADDHDS
jgi:hypothetical protein